MAVRTDLWEVDSLCKLLQKLGQCLLLDVEAAFF